MAASRGANVPRAPQSVQMRRMLAVSRPLVNNCLDLDYVGVKVPMFSVSRVVGADPMLGVEMTSTGEAGCLGDDLHEALLHGLLATGFRIPCKGVLLSLGPVAEKYWFSDETQVIDAISDTLMSLQAPRIGSGNAAPAMPLRARH